MGIKNTLSKVINSVKVLNSHLNHIIITIAISHSLHWLLGEGRRAGCLYIAIYKSLFLANNYYVQHLEGICVFLWCTRPATAMMSPMMSYHHVPKRRHAMSYTYYTHGLTVLCCICTRASYRLHYILSPNNTRKVIHIGGTRRFPYLKEGGGPFYYPHE